jgi:DNA-damage-inducible protein J
MNNSTNLNIRIDKNVKETSEKVFEDLGLNMTTAINMFLRQVIRVNGIPFEIKGDSIKQLDEKEKGE